MLPSANLNLSRFTTDSSPAFGLTGGILSPKKERKQEFLTLEHYWEKPDGFWIRSVYYSLSGSLANAHITWANTLHRPAPEGPPTDLGQRANIKTKYLAKSRCSVNNLREDKTGVISSIKKLDRCKHILYGYSLKVKMASSRGQSQQFSHQHKGHGGAWLPPTHLLLILNLTSSSLNLSIWCSYFLKKFMF